MLHRSLHGRARKRIRALIGVVAVTSAVLASAAWSAAASPTPPSPPKPSAQAMQAWNTEMTQIATPAKGCFTAAYPKLAWRSVACGTAPDRPYFPPGVVPAGSAVSATTSRTTTATGTAGNTSTSTATGTTTAAGLAPGLGTGPAAGAGLGPAIVGNGVDYSAGVLGVMNGAQGSFPSVTGVTSETGIGGANSYSLQLNTKPFASPLCAGHPLCSGWEQFLYTNQGYVFIQFWLLEYNAACPAAWNTVTGGGNIYCWENGSATPVTPQPITNLANLSLKGTVTGGAGGMDTAAMSVTGTSGPFISAATSDSVLNLSADWAAVEFAIVGDGGGSSANFNPGATIVVQTTTHNGTTAAPFCLYEGYTGETNNLTLTGTAPVAIGPSPYLQSTQSNIPGSPPSCASASGWGDTHITTFDGLSYDFQYRGPVTDVQSPTMTIQANQVSGAPTWSNMAVNNSVATQMGSDKVALCQAGRLVVDGSNASVADGGKLILASGDVITHSGSTYLVTDPSGDSVSLTIGGPTYHIDIAAGLGQYPEAVSGLFANAPGNVNQFQTSTGTLLNAPIGFQSMYSQYGQSWRVAPSDSLLSVCDNTQENPLPSGPFWASSLPAGLYTPSRAVCQKVGVQDPTLLDDCTLDVAVLGDSSAANVYIGKKPPVVVGFKPQQ